MIGLSKAKERQHVKLMLNEGSSEKPPKSTFIHTSGDEIFFN